MITYSLLFPYWPTIAVVWTQEVTTLRVPEVDTANRNDMDNSTVKDINKVELLPINCDIV